MNERFPNASMEQADPHERERRQSLETAQSAYLKALEGARDGLEVPAASEWEGQERRIRQAVNHYLAESVMEKTEEILRGLPPQEQVKFYEQAPTAVEVSAGRATRWRDEPGRSWEVPVQFVSFDAIQGAPSFGQERYRELAKLMLRTRLLRAVAEKPWNVKDLGALSLEAEEYLMALDPAYEPDFHESESSAGGKRVSLGYDVSTTADRDPVSPSAVPLLRGILEKDPDLFTDAAVIALVRKGLGGLGQDLPGGPHAVFLDFLKKEAGASATDGIPYRSEAELMRIRGLLERERRNLEDRNA